MEARNGQQMSQPRCAQRFAGRFVEAAPVADDHGRDQRPTGSSYSRRLLVDGFAKAGAQTAAVCQHCPLDRPFVPYEGRDEHSTPGVPAAPVKLAGIAEIFDRTKCRIEHDAHARMPVARRGVPNRQTDAAERRPPPVAVEPRARLDHRP